MFRSKFAGVLLASIALATTAMAASLPEGWSEPTVAHEGTRVMTAGGQTVQSSYHYLPPGKHREQMTLEGVSMSIVIRQDLGVVWTIFPPALGNMHMEMAIDEAEHGGPSMEGIVEFEAMGQEEVSGWPTTRYRVVMMEDGKEAEGYFWITEHWIPIRMEIAMRDDPEETIIMEIRDLQIRDQDPALFELPTGSRAMPAMGGMPGRGG